MTNYDDYFKTRFKWSKDREIVWKEISRYLNKKYISSKSKILELGSGYCNFINNIRASKKYALDKFNDPKKNTSPGIISIFGDDKMAKSKIPNHEVDVIFASNFLEHLDQNELERYMALIKLKLKKGGLLILLQPNYRYCYENYFDDYTHKQVWTDVSLSDYLINKGFVIKKSVPRFMPFSMNSRLPKNKYLVRAYLNSPIKPLAKQMLIIAQLS